MTRLRELDGRRGIGFIKRGLIFVIICVILNHKFNVNLKHWI